MKPEPLKRKGSYMPVWGFEREDIASAVEFAKSKSFIIEIPKDAIGKDKGKFIKVIKVEDLNEAFWDVVKK